MSILFPSVDKLLDKVDSRYKLVTLAAKRANQLNEYDLQIEKADHRAEEGGRYELPDNLPIGPTLNAFDSTKSIGQALEEIEAGNVIIDK
jgi:DNA-directed RNA polymerase subunit omega